MQRNRGKQQNGQHQRFLQENGRYQGNISCKRKAVKPLSHVRLFATPWTAAYQPSLSMEFSRQKYWSALSFPSPEELSDPGIKPGSPTLQANALPSEPPEKSGDLGSIPGWGRFPGGRHSNLLQYSCLENPHGQRSLSG